MSHLMKLLGQALGIKITKKSEEKRKAEVRHLHCPPSRRDACPIWQKGYDVLGFKDEEPNHVEGCSYRRFFGPMVSSAQFTRAEWEAWEERSQKAHYSCENKRIVTEAVKKGEIEGAFIAEDGKPYKIGL